MRGAPKILCFTMALLTSFGVVTPSQAQQDDRDFLTAFLEDSLSGAGREVTVTGFSGALSSQASAETITIADDRGIWLTLDDVALDWSRSALLSGAVDVTALTAGVIRLERWPDPEAAAAPTAEAAGFALPDLPVSVDIGALRADRIELGTAILGQPVTGSLSASLTLADGQGQAVLDLRRTDDGPAGQIALDASYANDTGILSLDLAASEAAGGIVAGLLDLPGAPEVSLTATGEGPLADFSATTTLQAGGTDLVSGDVRLAQSNAGGLDFDAVVEGNLVPLVPADYAGFFGTGARLSLSGTRSTEGALSLDTLDIATQALSLRGTLSLAPDGHPQAMDLSAAIADPDGAPIVLPIGGDVTTAVDGATLRLIYDAAKGEGWTFDLAANGLDRPDVRVETMTLHGSGRIGRLGRDQSLGATLAFAADGLVPTDTALAKALGPQIEGEIVAHKRASQDGLAVPRLTLTGQDYRVSANGRIDSLSKALAMTGRLTLSADDLSRFDGLAGRPVSGQAMLTASGTGSPLAGTFDLESRIEGRDLALGEPRLDTLLAGGATIDLSARRDETGTDLRLLRVEAATLRAESKGRLTSAASDVTAALRFTDIAALGAGYRGGLTLDATYSGALASGTLTLSGRGSDLRLGQTEIDRLLRGNSDLRATLDVADRAVSIRSFALNNPQVGVTAKGSVTEALREVTLDARLANLGLLLPDFPGALTLRGTARDEGQGYQLNLSGQGPGQIDARLTGSLAPGGNSADLRLVGTGQAALVNAFIEPRTVSGPARFDLSLNGPLTLASLRGQVRLTDARLADVGAGLAFGDVAATITFAQGQARVEAQGAPASGGRATLAGTIGLAAPYPGDLTVRLQDAVFRDPGLYRATAFGDIRVTGPMRGGARIAGRVTIREAEIRIPNGSSDALGALPDIVHRNDRAAVRATRVRAGLEGGTNAAAKAGNGGGPGFGLDVLIDAPGRLFVRGRGLDAELNGQLRLTGTTTNIVPAGQFSLIRGRLDILGKRLTLSEASLRLEGAFVPYLSVAASTVSQGVTATVRIDGPADDPAITFTASPDLPEEEVLAQLLFGRSLDSLSAFQAAQLASAVATLAGRGGSGLIGRLRGKFGLDDLDVATDESGSTVVRAGKYISDNIYSEVEVDENGQSQINLNLDLRPGVTVKGRVGADGDTGIGVFLERDY